MSKDLRHDDFDELDEDRREDIIEYWEEFFELAADPGRHARILRDCQEIQEQQVQQVQQEVAYLNLTLLA